MSRDTLQSMATGFTESDARAMDERDPLAPLRDEFCIPPSPADTSQTSIYLCGNSLGCMPRKVETLLAEELEDWKRLGVEAHLEGRRPWFSYHEQFREPLARLVGAEAGEVVAMNSLTVNLHLLMVTFYRPAPERFAIMIEDDAFPSDGYAAITQIDSHGFDPGEGLIRLKPRAGEAILRTEDVIGAIERETDRLAMILLPGVSYLTGQVFDIESITKAANEAGVPIGWDLAHAAGNVPLRLHDWGCDFACWCSYKYLNSGPGAIAGAFIHERHAKRTDLPRFAGWWANDPATRFRMGPEYVPVPTADGWQISNPPILSLTPLIASLELFDRATMPALREKSEKLTGYLSDLIERIPGVSTHTPSDARGCQLSLIVDTDARSTHTKLTEAGVISDFREPNVIRVAPVPLYNSFHDVWRFADVLRRVLS